MTSPHGAHPSNTDTGVTCPAVHIRSPLTLLPSSSFGHFSPSTMQPSSPSTSISPFRVSLRGYKQQNNAELPNQALSNSSVSYLPPAASSQPKHSTGTPSSVCHLPLHLCCSQHSPQEDPVPQTTPGAQLSPTLGLQLTPLLHTTRNDVK